MHGPVRTSFETRVPVEARESISAAFTPVDLRVLGDTGDFYYRHERVDLGGVQLDAISNATTVELHTGPLRRYQVLRVIRGEHEIERCGERECYRTGDIALTADPDHGFRVRTVGDVQLVSIDPALLTGLDQGFDRTAPGFEPVPPTLARFWLHTVRYLTDIVADPANAVSSPIVLGGAGRLLAATFLATFLSGPVDRHPAHNGTGATSATVRLAVAFIEANPDLDITVADIARAAHVGVRALQLAFRRHLDITPLALLRKVRLERAHADLKASGAADGDTVTGISARWGFTDPSRFTANYRAEYGTTPSTTLNS